MARKASSSPACRSASNLATVLGRKLRQPDPPKRPGSWDFKVTALGKYVNRDGPALTGWLSDIKKVSFLVSQFSEEFRFSK